MMIHRWFALALAGGGFSRYPDRRFRRPHKSPRPLSPGLYSTVTSYDSVADSSVLFISQIALSNSSAYHSIIGVRKTLGTAYL